MSVSQTMSRLLAECGLDGWYRGELKLVWVLTTTGLPPTHISLPFVFPVSPDALC